MTRVDPEYVCFHNSTLQYTYIAPPHNLAWNFAIHNAPAVSGGSQHHTKHRALTEGEIPEGGWQVFIFFNGEMDELWIIFRARRRFRRTWLCCLEIPFDYWLAGAPVTRCRRRRLDRVLENGKQELKIRPTPPVSRSADPPAAATSPSSSSPKPSHAPPSPLLLFHLLVPVNRRHHHFLQLRRRFLGLNPTHSVSQS